MSKKPSLSKEDISKIGYLARIAIDDADIAKYATDLSNTLDLIAKIEHVDTKDITPMAHPLNCVQRFRADDVSEIDQHKKFQKIAPQVEADLYLVPKVIE